MPEEYPITLDDVWREAEALEFDITMRDGCLEIRKRGGISWRFASLQPVNQAIIWEAWCWLQRYRALLDQLDQIRS